MYSNRVLTMLEYQMIVVLRTGTGTPQAQLRIFHLFDGSRHYGLTKPGKARGKRCMDHRIFPHSAGGETARAGLELTATAPLFIYPTWPRSAYTTPRPRLDTTKVRSHRDFNWRRSNNSLRPSLVEQSFTEPIKGQCILEVHTIRNRAPADSFHVWGLGPKSRTEQNGAICAVYR